MENIVELFEKGAMLCLWRNSTPHNMWLEFGDEQLEIDGMEYRKLVDISKQKITSDTLVTYGNFLFKGSDDGKPVMDGHFFERATDEQELRVKTA